MEDELKSCYETFGVIADYLGIDLEGAKSLPGKPSDVFIRAIKSREQPANMAQGKYSDVLNPFFLMMDCELRANAGKGDRRGWLSMAPDECMLEIYYHASKLQKAVRDQNSEGVAEYAADVANMAMMMADIFGILVNPTNGTIRPQK